MAKTVAKRKTNHAPRRRKAPEYERFRYSKRIKHPGVKLSSGWRIFWRSLKPLRQHWKLFGGILLIYGVLSIIFVRGFSDNLNLTELKTSIEEVFGGTAGQLSTGVTLLGVLVSSTGSGDQTASTYQSILLLLTSLSLIWTLRQVHSTASSSKPTVKQAFYKSMHPLVPFLLVLIVIALKLIPLLIGGTIYSIVISNGLAVGALEQIAWAGMFFLLVLWSLYMLVPSVLALFIVTLPDMTPMKALRSARELIRYRRWTVMRKMLFLPLMLVVLAMIIMLPLVLWLTPVAEWSYFVLNLLAAAVVLSYLYTLYRELL